MITVFRAKATYLYSYYNYQLLLGKYSPNSLVYEYLLLSSNIPSCIPHIVHIGTPQDEYKESELEKSA